MNTRTSGTGAAGAGSGAVMRLILAVLVVIAAVANAQEFETVIYDSTGVELDPGENHEIIEGDYITCTWRPPSNPPDDGGAGAMSRIFFTWQKIENRIGFFADGPVVINLPIQERLTNHLYMANPLGFGEPTAYRCIGSNNFDPADPDRGEFEGTPVYFTVVSRLPAGVVFPERDYVQAVGGTIDLACIRSNPDGIVVWETINQSDDSRVTLIYDSSDPQQLPDNYVFINNAEDENDFSLRLTMDQNNELAITHRCTITDPTEALATVRSEAMVFAAHFDGGGCSSDPADLVDLEIGADITFSGCDVTVGIATQSGLTYDDFTTMTLWTHLTADGELIRDFDDTRVFDAASTFTTTVAPEFDATVIGCAVQVHREEVSVVMARVDDICEDQLLVDVADTATRFRIYYGDRSEMDYNDFISFGTFNRYKADVQTGGDLTCELDAIPEPAAGSVKMQTQSPGEHEWVTDDDNIIEQAEIVSGAVYRCIYEDQPDVISGGVHMTAGVVTTVIYNSRGEQLNEDEVYDINGGDYLECRASEDVSNYYPPQYVWQIDRVVGNNQGPHLVRRQNGQGFVNRLYIDQELGRGDVIGYRCIGTDDLSQPMIGMVGTLVKFRVVDVPAGSVFDAGDHAVEVGETLDLTCARAAADVRVMWETVNLAGDVIATLYDSQSPGSLPTGYEFIDSDPEQSNDFSVRIIVSLDTAIFTRCSLQPEGITRSYTAVSQTTLIFAVDQVEECSITDSDTIDVGEIARLRGCDASVHVSEQSGVYDEDFQAIMHWAVRPSGTDNFTVIKDSRVLDKESIHEETALTEVDGNSYQCGIQISRPNAITNSATIANLCDVDVTLHVTDSSVNFRIYYGEVTDEDLLDLGPYTTYVGNENNKDMTCEIDRHPPPDPDSEVHMQTRASPNDDWDDTGSATVPADDIITGHQYRCQYTDGTSDRQSTTISIVDGINDIYAVEIVNSAGEILNDQEVYHFTSGDYVTCRPADGSVYRLQYMWVQDLFGVRPEGPTVIQIPTDELGENRLYMSTSLGEGEETGYRCIAADNIVDAWNEAPIPFLGQLLKFTVSTGAGIEEAGTPPPEQDYAATADAQILIPCTRATDSGRVVWETLPASGAPVLIYDSEVDDWEIPDGYDVVVDGQNHQLQVTVAMETALVTQCTITEPGRATVSGDVMVFLVEPFECGVTGHMEQNGLGDMVQFGGCGGTTITAEHSGITVEHFDAVSYWQQGVTGEDSFTILEESKILAEGSAESQYHMTVDGDDHETTLRCGIQIKRPGTASAAGSIHHLCADDYHIAVGTSDVYFQMQYGGEPVMFMDDANPDEMVTLAYVDGWEIHCQAEEFPSDDGATVTIQERLQGEDWVPHEEDTIDGTVDAAYRCMYTSGLAVFSAALHLVEPINTVPELGIYRSNSDQLIAEDTIITVDAGDYLVCRPLDNEVVEPGLYYIWEKQGDVSGPRMLHYENEMDGSNRLLVNSDLGSGANTQYMCRASLTDDLEPEGEGRLVQFNVEFSTGGSSMIQATLISLLLPLSLYWLVR